MLCINAALSKLFEIMSFFIFFNFSFKFSFVSTLKTISLNLNSVCFFLLIRFFLYYFHLSLLHYNIFTINWFHKISIIIFFLIVSLIKLFFLIKFLNSSIELSPIFLAF